MNLYDYSDLNEIQLDALREIGNIGSGNAATALSQMLDRPVNIAVPRVTVLDYQTVAERLGGPEELMIGLLLTISGDLTGMIMFLPSFCMDMVGAILSVPTIYYANISDKIIYIEDEFNNNINHAASHVLLIPEVEALQKMMRSLGLG
jgi:chemotaxis protein CheY-P-specific phosphatase CheC